MKHTIDYDDVKDFKVKVPIASSVGGAPSKQLHLVATPHGVRFEVTRAGELVLNTPALVEAIQTYNQFD